MTDTDAPPTAEHDDPGSGAPPPSIVRRVAPTLALGAVSIAAMWIVAPEAVRATFSGPGPLLRVLFVIVALVAWSAFVRSMVPQPWVARVLALAPVVLVSWWAITPYLTDDRVDEDFPVVAAAPTPPAGEPSTTTLATPTSGAAASSTTTAPPTTEAPAAEPVRTHSGSFQGLTGHRGNGTASIYDLPDGSRLLRLEDFDVSNGPGLELHLVPGADQRRPGDGTKIADLKGNRGNQNYDLPADLDLDGEWTVLIWCAPFTVEVANATL